MHINEYIKSTAMQSKGHVYTVHTKKYIHTELQCIYIQRQTYMYNTITCLEHFAMCCYVLLWPYTVLLYNVWSSRIPECRCLGTGMW